MNRHIQTCAMILLLLLALVASGAVSQDRSEPQTPATKVEPGVAFQERLLATIPEGFELVDQAGWQATFSADGRRVAYIASHRVGGDLMQCIFIGDHRGPDFKTVGHPTFSPNGSALAYFAVETSVGSRKTTDYLVIAEAERVTKVENPYAVPESGPIPVFSPDGAKVACERYLPGIRHSIVVVDAVSGSFRSGPVFYDVSTPVFSPDSKTLAYTATAYRTKDNKQFLVTGDEKGPKFDTASSPVFCPDGRVAYIAAEAGKQFIVVGDTKGPIFDEVYPPSFSAKDGKLAYAAREGQRHFIVVGDQKQETKFEALAVVFNKDGNFAYWGFRSDLRSMIVRDKPGPEYDLLFLPVFSPDLVTVAYWAQRGDKNLVVVGGQEGHVSDIATYLGTNIYQCWPMGCWPVFSPDGSKVAYGTLEGRQFWWRVVDVQR